MKFLSRVVWSEGMYLAPHHFQTQSRYFEDSIAFLASSLWQESWGVLQIEMDSKAVRNGTVSLLHASGIFQDGLTFDMPTSDVLPPSRTVSSLAASMDSDLVVYLAVPVRRSNGYDMSTEEGESGARYSGMSRVLRDETNGVDEHEVELARKNIMIIGPGEQSPDMLSLPIARILREPDGQFTYDKDFVPCSLRISASDVLMLSVKRLIGVLREKSATIAQPVHVSNRLQVDSLPADIANYWLLHAIYSALPALRHRVNARRAHPSDVFLELSRLAGALCTFTLGSDPRDLPSYDHVNPGPAFAALCTHILKHLEVIVPTNTIKLEFAPSGPYIHSAPVLDERCLRRSRWVLGIRSSLGESEQLRLVPRLVKVCSARFVPELVKRALPGMTLTHMQVPPSALRASVDMQYYSIDTAGPCWQHILHAQSVGIYIPGEISEPEFTLTVLMEQPV